MAGHRALPGSTPEELLAEATTGAGVELVALAATAAATAATLNRLLVAAARGAEEEEVLVTKLEVVAVEETEATAEGTAAFPVPSSLSSEAATAAAAACDAFFSIINLRRGFPLRTLTFGDSSTFLQDSVPEKTQADSCNLSKK